MNGNEISRGKSDVFAPRDGKRDVTPAAIAAGVAYRGAV